MKTYHWMSPSNIALVKYWGKKTTGVQLPANASISFTLNNCYTQTELHFSESDSLTIDVFLDGKLEPAFEPKIQAFFKRASSEFPFLSTGKYQIHTHNTFPHSSGIASSASGMSALALCICDLAEALGVPQTDFFQSASNLARLGSGSASRSVFGPLAIWGLHPRVPQSSDEYAVQYADVHPVFTTFCDTILLVHKGQKSISSTIGHDLIHEHPFAQARFTQAQQNLASLLNVMKEGDVSRFIEIVESEALVLHSLMMSSNPYFILMQPNTLAIIQKIWLARKELGVKWCFTLDAGANVHFLYPEEDKIQAQKFILDELAQYCEEGGFIHDHVGAGPRRV